MGIVVGSASVGGDITPLVCNKPGGTADKDMMFSWQLSDFGNYSSLTAPAGWTFLTGLDMGSSEMHLKIWYKLASSEGASYSWPMGSGVDGCVSIVTTRGINLNPATWLWATPVWAANSQTRVAPSVSGARPNALLLSSCSADANDVACTWTPPSGMTERADIQSNGWATQSVASLANPSDPSGTKTFTASVNNFFPGNGGIEWSIVLPNSSGGFFRMF